MKRFLETWAIMMVGEGLISTIFPKRHLKLWNFKRGPGIFRKTTKGLIKRPKLTRMLGVAEAIAGAAVACKALRKV